MSAPILVSGAAGSIGGEIARTLEAHGHDILMTDVASTGDRLIPASLPEEAESLARRLPDRLGGLVHAMGVIATHAPLDWTDATFDTLFRTNVLAPLRLTALLSDRLIPGASVIFVGSVAALKPTPNNLLYGATKAALHHAAGTLALALAPRGIRVNVIAPGLIDGPLTGTTNEALGALTRTDPADVAKARVKAIPQGRIGMPADIAATVAFMMSDKAGFMVGAVVPVTGGGHL